MKYTKDEMEVIEKRMFQCNGFLEPFMSLEAIRNYILDNLLYHKLQMDSLAEYAQENESEDYSYAYRMLLEKDTKLRMAYDILVSIDDNDVCFVEADRLEVVEE